MGLFRRLLGRGSRVDPAHKKPRRPHICRIEQFETRLAMAANLHVGSVYYERAGGDDALPNTIEFTYEGGADRTQLTQIIIDGDKDGRGRSSGDIFFDTSAGGLGAFKSNPLRIVSHDGFNVVGTHVEDGGMRLVIDLEGFDAGETLVISIDVDESQFVDPDTGEIDTNAVAEGGEFQRSHFYATFEAPHYEEITTHVQFWDEYDDNFETVARQTGSQLDLPPDRYRGPVDLSDFTAGAVAQAEQIPLPSSISGVVFVDQNLNNRQEAGEQGIGNVNLTLLLFDGATYVASGKTTVTDTQGNYAFEGLAPGTYRVVETQPLGYFSVGARAGTVDGVVRGVVTNDDVLSEISLLGGEDSIRNDFAEALPNSISGYVHADRDGDCVRDPGEPRLEGVVILLLNERGDVIATTVTDSEGFYRFDNLAPGTYGIFEKQPDGYLNGDHHAGSAGGLTSDIDTITEIVLTSGVEGVNYDFCELEAASISGYVHVDLDGDCTNDPGEPPLEGVVIRLVDESGAVIRTTTTNANGFYIFDDLAPGTYGVIEEQPDGYLNGATQVGSLGGVLGVDTVTEIVLPAGVEAVEYNFCEVLPGSISGFVYVSTTEDCEHTPDSPPIAGVTIELRDAAGTVITTTLTDANGYYLFDDLAPGIYSVHEIQPAGYFNGATHVGSVGGVLGDDVVSEIMLLSAVDAVEYNFCEIPPADLCGWVYVDANNNGQRDTGEVGIGGVTLELKDAQGNPTGLTTITDADGRYCFLDLRPGTYAVGEIQPVGYLDGLDSPGTEGGFAQNPGDMIMGIALKPGVSADEYNFGELLPASIGGHVVARDGENCEIELGATPISGVTVQLLDANGSIVATTTTNANGQYLFNELLPGTYSVLEIQPTGYFEGEAHEGSVGGEVLTTNLISEIVLGSGTRAVHYDFCEIPPATISGFVFQDGPPIPVTDSSQPIFVPDFRDGSLTPDDTMLPGVTLMLRDGVTGEPILGSVALVGTYPADQPITTVTDAGGFYEFVGLPPGVYGVYEVAPEGYIRGIDTAGSLGGIVISNWTTVPPSVLDQLTSPPTDDAIIDIGLPAGKHSTDNNFSVVVTAPEVQVFVLPGGPQPQVAAAAPFNPSFEDTFAPVIPQLPFLVAPQLTRAGGHMYTWHLSIVNAGQPRGVVDGGAQFQLTSASNADQIAWRRPDMVQAEWTLLTDVDDPASARTVRFGMQGGTPITGDFNGDGKSELAIFKDGRWYIDLNDNGVWDEGDLWAKLGHRYDLPVTGDWDGDGKDDIGIYGPAWLRDPRAIKHEPGLPDPDNKNTHVHKNIPRHPHRNTVGHREMKHTASGKRREDIIDHVFLYGMPGDHPIVGDWNGDGIDTIAVFRDGRWHRDRDGDGKWTNSDAHHGFGQKGDKPVVGDFNGDGVDDLGVFRDGVWYIDTNGNGIIDGEDMVIHLGAAGDYPVVGDWDGDGTSDPGVYHNPGATVRTVRK